MVSERPEEETHLNLKFTVTRMEKVLQDDDFDKLVEMVKYEFATVSSAKVSAVPKEYIRDYIKSLYDSSLGFPIRLPNTHVDIDFSSSAKLNSVYIEKAHGLKALKSFSITLPYSKNLISFKRTKDGYKLVRKGGYKRLPKELNMILTSVKE